MTRIPSRAHHHLTAQTDRESLHPLQDEGDPHYPRQAPLTRALANEAPLDACGDSKKQWKEYRWAEAHLIEPHE